jgi:hypothetical protein
MRERHRAGEDVAAVCGVRQVRQRRRQPNRYFAGGGDADGFVPEPLARFSVSGQEPAGRLPLPAPLRRREPGFGEVEAFAQQPLSTPHHAHVTGGTVSLRAREPLFEDRKAPCLLKPLIPGPVAARHTARAL